MGLRPVAASFTASTAHRKRNADTVASMPRPRLSADPYSPSRARTSMPNTMAAARRPRPEASMPTSALDTALRTATRRA